MSQRHTSGTASAAWALATISFVQSTHPLPGSLGIRRAIPSCTAVCGARC